MAINSIRPMARTPVYKRIEAVGIQKGSSMKYPHAHVQIEYEATESLIGFNPSDAEDRKLCHDMLDEYLDVLALRRQIMMGKGIESMEIPGAGFTVFPTLDTH